MRKLFIYGLGLLVLVSFTQCSNKDKDRIETVEPKIEKKIRTITIYFSYVSSGVEAGKQHQEYLSWLYMEYCYKSSDNYPESSFEYKGDIVDGKLIAKIYKKDRSFFEFPLTVFKYQEYLLKKEDKYLYIEAQFSYSGEEIRIEIRRISTATEESVLLLEQEIPDFTDVDWKKAEEIAKHNSINGSGFGEISQCFQSPGRL